MAYRITYTDKGSIVDCSGTLNMQDVHEANGILHGHARFDEHTYQIWNLLNADMSQITEYEMNEPAAIDCAAEKSVAQMKVALVVQNDYAVKLCEYYKKTITEFGSKWKCQLFDSMDDAQLWVVS